MKNRPRVTAINGQEIALKPHSIIKATIISMKCPKELNAGKRGVSWLTLIFLPTISYSVACF